MRAFLFSQPMPQAQLSAARRGYGAAWQRARAGYLASHPMCAMCQQLGRLQLATVVDHIQPHKLADALESGDAGRIAAARRLFWDRGNWQPLCKYCHDGAKQRQDRTGRTPGASLAGEPLDPGHHWYR
jgi:5-methylcytosine-specific restriction enzyme A